MRIGEHGTVNECPVCGKAFWVAVPEMWVYKITHRKCCSWKCLRAAEKSGLLRQMDAAAGTPKEVSGDA